MAYPSAWEPSRRRNRCQPLLFHSSVYEDASHPTIGLVPHNAIPQHTRGGQTIPVIDPTPIFQLPTQSFPAHSHRASHSFHSIGVAREECSGLHGLDGGRPCIERVERKSTLYATCVPEVQIYVSQELLHAGHYARRDPLLTHYSRAEGHPGLLSTGVHHDTIPIAPNVLRESVSYNNDWTVEDMIHFTGILIEESEITCQWGVCGDRLRVKEIKMHLMDKHQVESNLKSYKCSWPGCLSGKPMTQLSSLVWHIQEHHGSVYKYWPCPTCERRYSREETLLRHFERCPGRNKPQVVLHRGQDDI